MPLTLEILSPEKPLGSRKVDMVVIPGTEGDLGILPGHSKLITSLRGGLVDIYEDNKLAERLFVTGGFAEVTQDRCSVLADSIAKQSDLNAEAAAKELALAKEAYQAADMTNPETYRELSDRLISAQAMVDSLPTRRGES